MGLFQKINNPREIRQKLGLNQEEFWQKIGVTQSGGSRYEAGRDMPKPVTELLRLVHLEGVDLSSVRKEDIQIIEFLRGKHPDLYAKLRDAVADETGVGSSSIF
ncbi:MAG TPA: helix-turn-helix domain-containing protein [Casimicrobium huifangae]|jgi:transcriptional regulator with XRE-family HTH domain|uniref:helix-turn-helix domain-containing protein n=1 Tax=Casimicrobium huifangae TaxID=2591109 RepID=UPI0012EBE01E|nr:helix-turn-helix domain-containing protein [Casimicrobium huifangae]HOB00123.1 helix-turn-helix domain-containing protein [Casimicrobium huifangae]HQA32821.1 helix-turn-helix domain-containing protein [Casimicrobium huifangae]HQD64256.1 helix-turn-helix domain-containing protein [Casimicrobium huifangae]